MLYNRWANKGEYKEKDRGLEEQFNIINNDGMMIEIIWEVYAVEKISENTSKQVISLCQKGASAERRKHIGKLQNNNKSIKIQSKTNRKETFVNC